ncbi:FxsA family protein [Thiohalobacter sp.]|uniref:FxsA family protein n=1 Tax=Thiohalobacter sp. TaxID=2025948 RepID=UPI002637AF8F|nr:FxsA family protein [Thiohalobacter sp.]
MSPFTALLLVFLTVPLIEIYLLIKVGGVIGAWPTVLLVVLTAVVGAFLIRLQGLATLQRVQLAMMRGEVPALEMLEGAVLVICGALLLTPGFFTDTLGFLLLIPALRRWLILRFFGRPGGPGAPPGGSPGPRGPLTLDGEYTRED